MCWAEIYTDLCSAFGWTWCYVDNEVTLPMLLEIYEAWSRRPPLHHLVASYMGVKPPEKPPTPEEQEAALAAQVAFFNNR